MNYIRQGWSLHGGEYGLNKSAFARTYVKLIAHQFSEARAAVRIFSRKNKVKVRPSRIGAVRLSTRRARFVLRRSNVSQILWFDYRSGRRQAKRGCEPHERCVSDRKGNHLVSHGGRLFPFEKQSNQRWGALSHRPWRHHCAIFMARL